jgi:hypothetical protein
MVRKRKPESSEFIEEWAKYKITFLSSIVNNVDTYEIRNFVPVWTHEWCQEWKVRYDCWDDFLNARNKEIEIFMETGDLVFKALPLVDSAGGINICEIVKKDCNDLIAIIQNSSHVTDKIRFFHNVEKIIIIIEAAWENLLTRHQLKLAQKKERSNSGIGQRKAKEERQAKFAESLRQHGKEDSDGIIINKDGFNELLDQVFVGLEDYPRHPRTKKEYREAAEKILGKRIIFRGQ